MPLLKRLSERHNRKRTSPTPEDFASALLLSYAAYNWASFSTPSHLCRLARALQDIEAGRIKRLIVAMPPRHGKTMLTSEFFPAWYLGRNPAHQIICAAYSQELADDMGRKVRNQLADPIYGAVFPGRGLRADSTSVRRFHTLDGGVYIASGVGGPITGRGAHLLLIDDPIKSRDDASSPAKRQAIWDWYTSVAYTRLMPGGAIVLVQTRWDLDDLAGRLLRDHADEGWHTVIMPALDGDGAALWPDMFPAEDLERIRKRIGERDFSALYQQCPTPRAGGVFEDDKILRAIGRVPWCDRLEDALPNERDRREAEVITGVDLATRKGEQYDYTAMVTILRQGHRYRVLNIRAARLEAAGILRMMLDVYRAFHAQAGRARFRVEDNAAQVYIRQMCRDARVLGAMGASETELARIHVQGHTTTAIKRHVELGVPGLAADLDMDRLDLPQHRETQALREEMLSWSPEMHTGDRLMALWIAREGLRAGIPGVLVL